MTKKNSKEAVPLSLSESLQLVLDTNKGSITLGSIIDAVGDKGFGLLLLVLSLPSALPIPAAGYSTPFGILMTLLGLQMVWGYERPWLPKRAKKMKLKRSLVKKMVASSQWFLNKIERFIRPRLGLFCGTTGNRIMGLLVIAMAFLMILPIPLTNTAPAFVIFLMGIGLSEDDGLFGLGAAFVALLSLALYSYVLYIFFKYGISGVLALKEEIVKFFTTC